MLECRYVGTSAEYRHDYVRGIIEFVGAGSAAFGPEPYRQQTTDA